jgi:hypothetical protein
MHTGSAPETSFRTATTQDIDALRQFEQAIVSAERAFDPTLRLSWRLEFECPARSFGSSSPAI